MAFLTINMSQDTFNMMGGGDYNLGDYSDMNSNVPEVGLSKNIDSTLGGWDYKNHGTSINDTVPVYSDPTGQNCSDQMKFFWELNRHKSPSQIIVPIIYCLICLVGLVGNGLVMFVIFGSKEMTKTVANIYIWNLAVADTLFLVTLPFSSTQRVMLSWPFGVGMCKIVEAVKYLNYFASIFFLTAMSIDRYIAVVYVVTSSRWRTSRNTFFVCAAIWLVSLVMVVPLLIYTRIHSDVCALVFNVQQGSTEPYYQDFGPEAVPFPNDTEYDFYVDNCDEKAVYNDYANVVPMFPEETGGMSGGYPGYEEFLAQYDALVPNKTSEDDMKVLCKHADSKTFHVFLIFTFVVGFVIPFFIITICYIMIIMRLLQPSETRGRSKQAERTRRKVTRMVIVLVITFFICWLPFYVWHLIQIRGIRANIGVCHNVRDFTFCLGYANSCLNPILYTFLGHNFQERLRKSIAISFRSFSFTTFTKYTSNTMSRGETAPNSRKMDTSHSEHCETPIKSVQPLHQVKETDEVSSVKEASMANDKLITEKE
ncbi:somatostatin receptor type 2-like [Clavelina lepadiformis]|uniref:somatostatin receptor type 2-like n=1 Tax=Clavelina lepadiformis TaxID=159417 RepID=UPI004042D69C